MGDRTMAEQETTIRWDNEEMVLHACTTCPRTMRRWQRHGYSIRVLSTTGGEPCSWAVTLPATIRGDWTRFLGRTVPRFNPRGERPETSRAIRGAAKASQLRAMHDGH